MFAYVCVKCNARMDKTAIAVRSIHETYKARDVAFLKRYVETVGGLCTSVQSKDSGNINPPE